MCIQLRNTLIYKSDANKHKREIESNKIIAEDFNTMLHQWTNNPDTKSIQKHKP